VLQELRKMVDHFGLAVVQAYMGHVQDNAEESVRRVITRLKDGQFTLKLDNGAQIQVAIRVDAGQRSAEVDFTGTSPQQTNNFNAPTAVCMAASQCTMNNFTFGNARYQYYETISGGSGAGALIDNAGQVVGGFNGTSVVQTHMTNSRLTDPEIFEFRFPARLESYAIRQGSGGAGRWHGGDGGVRRVRFLEPMTASILSNGRIHGAFGMAGGQSGQPGINRVVRLDGTVEDLGHIGQAEMLAGDVFEIHTPGGGGFGGV
jgi:N-methylhydantoinase B/oxoprolinase/acetone carboxylase alpha subunit